MDKQFIEFDDFEDQFEYCLDMVISDGVVIAITAQAVPLAAIVPLPLWEMLQNISEENNK